MTSTDMPRHVKFLDYILHCVKDYSSIKRIWIKLLVIIKHLCKIWQIPLSIVYLTEEISVLYLKHIRDNNNYIFNENIMDKITYNYNALLKSIIPENISIIGMNS